MQRLTLVARAHEQGGEFRHCLAIDVASVVPAPGEQGVYVHGDASDAVTVALQLLGDLDGSFVPALPRSAGGRVLEDRLPSIPVLASVPGDGCDGWLVHVSVLPESSLPAASKPGKSEAA